jgi:predicted DsbA family dithiol-disulfide isomerase
MYLPIPITGSLIKIMKVNIWSDVRCPFCYIGKIKFELALEKFPHHEQIEVTWRSFQLDPTLETQKDVSIYDYFSKVKGVSQAQAREMFNNVTEIAREVELDFKLEQSVVANSFNAHRLIQFAKSKGLGNEIEEALFIIHFTEGKDIDDPKILAETGVSIGLDEQEVKAMLDSDAFSQEVKQDEALAQTIGVRGVPFFVFNDKYAVSGAQSPETFLQVLEKSWEEFEAENKPLTIIKGASCSTDGSCE